MPYVSVFIFVGATAAWGFGIGLVCLGASWIVCETISAAFGRIIFKRIGD